jgi:Kae1-associated kinase Bud32
VADRIRWLAGEPALCAALERAWSQPAGGAVEVVRDRPGRRRLVRVRLADGSRVFVKVFAADGEKRRQRRAWLRALRLEAARREWRHLRRLARAGVPVPAPLALGVLASGDRVLAMENLEGRTLAEALEAPGPRRRMAEQVGALVAALHRSGTVHRDLHPGNILLSPRGPVLLDLQLAWRSRAFAARRRDLGELDAALEGRLGLAARLRLRAAALELERPFDDAAARRLRAVAATAGRRARAHARSRMQRALRPGRRFEFFSRPGAAGLRLRDCQPEVLAAALDAFDAGPARDPASGAIAGVPVEAAGRRVRVRGFEQRGTARRAWQAGHGLAAHRIAAPAPLAFLERPGAGAPAGWLVLDDAGTSRSLADVAAADPDGAERALGRLGLRLAFRGVSPEALGARGVELEVRDGRLEPRLVWLEQIRFPRVPTRRAERAALARLDASLAGLLPEPARARLRRLWRAFSPASGR